MDAVVLLFFLFWLDLAIRLPQALSTSEYDASSFITSADKTDVVGRGSFGVVRRCFHDDLKNIVVKCIQCRGSVDAAPKTIDLARKEIRFLTQFKHSHIVQTHGIAVWDQCFGIIMEEVEGGNLRDLMIINKDNNVDWKLRFRIIFQLADALKYLHFHNSKKSFVHLDVKPENILLTSNKNVKLADFGSLQIAIATGATSTATGTSPKSEHTPLYTSPERLNDVCGTKVDRSMDVYSFAMICYEVITRREVFQDATVGRSVLINLIAGNRQKPNRQFIDDLEEKMKKQNSEDLEVLQHLKKVMEKCWCFKPENRISMKDAFQLMIEFARCKDSYELDAKSDADEITEANQKAVASLDKKVPLNHLFHPFV